MLPGYKLFGILPLYFSFHAVAVIALLVLLLSVCKHYGISPLKTAVGAASLSAAAYLWMMVLWWAATGFRVFGGQNFVRVFVWVPLFTVLVAKLLKVDWRSLCDMVAPCLTLAFGIGHIACIFAGCCYGFESPHGVYNAVYHKYLFPVQLWEAGTALAITAFLLYIMKRRNYKTNGWLYPIMLVLFGSTRFFWEFFRNNEKIIGQVSELALWALASFVVGAVWLIVLKAKEERQNTSSDLHRAAVGDDYTEQAIQDR